MKIGISNFIFYKFYVFVVIKEKYYRTFGYGGVTVVSGFRRNGSGKGLIRIVDPVCRSNIGSYR